MKHLLSASIFLFCLTPLALAQGADTLRVGDVSASRGTTATGVIRIPDGVDKGVDIPISVVHGKESGKVLALVAGDARVRIHLDYCFAAAPASARPVAHEGPPIILLAMEDVTEMMDVAETFANHINDMEKKLLERTNGFEQQLAQLQAEVIKLQKHK